MSSAALHEGGLPAQLSQVQVRGDAPGATTTATSGADPAQAALILLLAGEADSSGRSRCCTILPTGTQTSYSAFRMPLDLYSNTLEYNRLCKLNENE